MLGVRNLHHVYTTGSSAVASLHGISFEVAQGEFYTLLGPSGCGKTTTLQCIAGLETPTHGEIIIGNTLVFSSQQRTNVPAHRRDLGMVFQSYAIWPHMTVFDNVAFPLVHGRRKLPRAAVVERVMHALELVQLDALAERPAPYLSGGQQQRVALARALVHEPAVLLLDEPLSNLDAKLREEMRIELRELVKRLHITTIYVTHDQVEALAMSDRIAVMARGQIVQEGTPRQIYQAPQDTFVADFVGRSNLLHGKVVVDDVHQKHTVATPLGTIQCTVPSWAAPGDAVFIAIRPESIRLTSSNNGIGVNVFAGKIEHVSFVGDWCEVQVQVSKSRLHVKLDPYTELATGCTVQVELPAERCVVLPATAGSTLEVK